MKINTEYINVDYYYPTLARVAEEAEETGIIIKPEDITFNLNDVRGAGLSFETEYIEVDKVLEFYSKASEYHKKEVEEIKNNKHYPYIQENYIFTITRDDYYDTNADSVSCEYWDGRGEYEASATDEKGNIYQVTWLTVDDLASSLADEDADICNWDIPYSIQLMEKANED